MNYIEIPSGEYSLSHMNKQHTYVINAFRISETKVTIKEYMDWYQESGLKNHIGGTYLYFNDVNPMCPVYYDNKQHKYICENNKANTPMVGVTWQGAMLYATDHGGRLPTEFEWELCARTNKGYKYPWGNELPNCEKANFGNSVPAGAFCPEITDVF